METPARRLPKPNQRPIVIAVIGTGSIGTRHLRVLNQIPEARAIAVPKRPGRATVLSTSGQVAACNIGEAAKMGATLGIIASDTGQHLEDGRAALTSGLAILVEKPLAIDSLEAKSLAEHADDANRRVFVGCVLRFSESLCKFRELLPRIERLHSVRIDCQTYLPDWRPHRFYRDSYSARADQGGVLRDLIHEIDYAGWLFGWPVSLQAAIRNLGRLGIPAEEAADLSWETGESCAVSLRLDYLTRPARRQITACGERGTLEWDGIALTTTLRLNDQPVYNFQSNQSTDEMFLSQTLAFIETARGTDDPRLATADDGVNALAVCDAARLASESRCEVKVAYL
jgi:predicted dehydrogenase